MAGKGPWVILPISGAAAFIGMVAYLLTRQGCVPGISSAIAPMSGTTVAAAYDQRLNTYCLFSIEADPTFTIDLCSDRTVYRARRYMTLDGRTAEGNRDPRFYENFAWSRDGVRWTYATTQNATGWGRFPYVPPLLRDAGWMGLPLGWTPWLEFPRGAVVARYMRYRVATALPDLMHLHEIEIQSEPAPVQ